VYILFPGGKINIFFMKRDNMEEEMRGSCEVCGQENCVESKKTKWACAKCGEETDRLFFSYRCEKCESQKFNITRKLVCSECRAESELNEEHDTTEIK
jgi:Zn finger protein HypA/HybF involved in hydrogenase expression